MVKASPRFAVPGFAKTAVASGEAVPAATSASWVSIGTTYVKMHRGKGTVTKALSPDWYLYDKGRLSINNGHTSTNGDVLALYGLDADGNVSLLGTSTRAAGTFPDIEFDITHEKYFLRNLSSTAAVTLTASLQGYHKNSEVT